MMSTRYSTFILIVCVEFGFSTAEKCPMSVAGSCHCEKIQDVINIRCEYVGGNVSSPIIESSPTNETVSYIINKLDLSSNNISALPEDYFENIQSVKTLDLQNNSLTEIPLQLLQVPIISTLNISHNSLKNLNISGLASETLQDLVCSNNVLESIYISENTSMFLRFVDISNNNLRTLPSALWSKASSLDLSNNHLHVISKLPECQLRYLNLDHNDIDIIVDGAFEGMRILEELHLSHNELVHLLPGHFTGLQSLKELHMSNNRIECFSEKPFRYLKSLITLQFSGNRLKSVSAVDFTGFEDNLQVLDLSHNRLTTIDKDAFENLENLRLLDLSYNKGMKDISHLGLPPHLASLIAKNNSLNTIGDCRFLKMKDIQNLDLSGNEFICSCRLSMLYAWYRGRLQHGYNEQKHQSMRQWSCKNNTDGQLYPVAANETFCDNYEDIEKHCLSQGNESSIINVSLTLQVSDTQVSATWDVKGDKQQIFGYVISVECSAKEIYKTPVLEKTQTSFIISRLEEESDIDVCINVLSNDTYILAKSCKSMSGASLDYVIGIMAGVVFLVPCIAALVFICRKDQMMQKLEYSQISEAENKAAQMEAGPVIIVTSEDDEKQEILEPKTEDQLPSCHENKAFEEHPEDDRDKITGTTIAETNTVTVDIETPQSSLPTVSENTRL